jgi:hypothetical protein
MNEVLQARDFYTKLGIDTIPLRPDDEKGDENGKKPIHSSWQKQAPRRMWSTAPQNANIGLRGGGEIGAAFLDCDDKKKAGTFDNVTNFLQGLGVTEYPLIQTVSVVGRHIYLTVTDAPEGNWCNLAQAVGTGEFRFGPGSYIVAAPSVVSKRSYNVLSGDFTHMPNISFADLRPILGEIMEGKSSPKVPRNALGILNGSPDAIAKFKSRSEAEQSLLLCLANASFTFEDVLSLFNNNPCAGKYAELKTNKPRNAKKYLAYTFNQARVDAKKDSKERQIVLRAIAWANNRPWLGRGGASDQAVFLAHMAIAYRAGTLKGWAADKRTLAEMAGLSEASKVTKRLLLANHIKLEKRSTVDCASIYSLSIALPLPKNLECVEVVTLCSDAFRKTSRLSIQGKRLTSGFGAIGRQLWVALKSNPMNDNELANFTKRDIRTVRKYLENMRTVVDQKTGEVLPMVELVPTAEGEKWQTLDVNLDAIALAIGTYGKGHKQIQEHARERRMHSKGLMAGKSR